MSVLSTTGPTEVQIIETPGEYALGQAVLSGAELARQNSEAARDESAENLQATGADRVATGQDKAATGADRVATTADRVATGEDRAAAAGDRQATGADAQATATDRVATGQDRSATAADAQQTALDRQFAAQAVLDTTTLEAAASQSAGAAAQSATDADTDRQQAQSAASSAQASSSTAESWAEGVEPGGLGTDSAKGWAQSAPVNLSEILGALGMVQSVINQLFKDLPPKQDIYATPGVLIEVMSVISQVADQVNGGQVRLKGGTLQDPALKLGSVGIYSSAQDTLSIAISGAEIARLTSSGLAVFGTVTEL